MSATLWRRLGLTRPLNAAAIAMDTTGLADDDVPVRIAVWTGDALTSRLFVLNWSAQIPADQIDARLQAAAQGMQRSGRVYAVSRAELEAAPPAQTVLQDLHKYLVDLVVADTVIVGHNLFGFVLPRLSRHMTGQAFPKLPLFFDIGLAHKMSTMTKEDMYVALGAVPPARALPPPLSAVAEPLCLLMQQAQDTVSRVPWALPTLLTTYGTGRAGVTPLSYKNAHAFITAQLILAVFQQQQFFWDEAESIAHD